jgi:23S rRNA pseudouridine1911/1915/1917 synthase
MRLDLLLIRHHPGLSRRKARDVIEKGQVSVDGAPVREAGREVAESAAVVYDPNRRALSRARCTLPVLHEDEHVIVVDKPAGLLTVPSAPGVHDEDTALRRVQDYAHRLKPRGGYAERVHRLDRDTSGTIAFALSREARAGLIETFRHHRIERRYLAIVEGEPEAESGTVDAPLREEWGGGRRRVAKPGEEQREARTHWRVRERLPGAALLEVRLETGRQHQIRVHLAHVGLPILGDPVYGKPPRMCRTALGGKPPRMCRTALGGKPPRMCRTALGGKPVHDRPLARRPMLHAFRLAFAHPVTGERVAVESPPPEDFQKALAALRRMPHGPG